MNNNHHPILETEHQFKILFAESDRTHQMAIAHTFEKLGLSIDFVTNGITLIEVIKKQRYSHIFIDAKLWHFDMETFTHHLVESERKHRTKITLIATTINKPPEDWNIHLFDHVLVKPFWENDLRNCLEKSIRENDSAPILKATSS